MSLCFLLFLWIVNSLLSGCQSPATEPTTSGYDYFPLETGRYVIYDVQESQYALNAVPMQRTYQLREVTGAAYTDVARAMAYKLGRYRRLSDSQNWQADSVWSARLLTNEGIRTENGQDFVKLVFPISDKLSWNGNRRNTSDTDDFELRNVGQPFRVQENEFDETVTVVAQNDSTLLSQDKRIDMYARQIGLIYKERTHLQFCSSTPACLGHTQIEYGIRQVYRIRSYGKE